MSRRINHPFLTIEADSDEPFTWQVTGLGSWTVQRWWPDYRICEWEPANLFIEDEYFPSLASALDWIEQRERALRDDAAREWAEVAADEADLQEAEWDEYMNRHHEAVDQ